MTLRRLLCCALLTLWVPSRGRAQQPGLGRNAPSANSALPKAAVAAGHVLAANDLITVKVFDEPNLDTIARISEDGRITFPLLGEIAVAGKTAQEAARVIRDRLEARFLVNPQVTLTVTEPVKRLFTVLGQVQRPGTYRFPDRETLNLLQVIGIAGGYTRLANPGRITVKRVVGGREVVIQLDGKKMARAEGTTAFEVAPSDLITVEERRF